MDFLTFISEQWLYVSILLVLIYLFALNERKRGGAPISAAEATRLLNQDQAVVVDIREKNDYKAGHITGAVHIPLARISERQDELSKYKDKTLVIACKMGQSAGTAGRQLQQAGYTVRKLQGGMLEWRNQQLPVVKD